jgi:hypothetical protein
MYLVYPSRSSKEKYAKRSKCGLAYGREDLKDLFRDSRTGGLLTTATTEGFIYSSRGCWYEVPPSEAYVYACINMVSWICVWIYLTPGVSHLYHECWGEVAPVAISASTELSPTNNSNLVQCPTSPNPSSTSMDDLLVGRSFHVWDHGNQRHGGPCWFFAAGLSIMLTILRPIRWVPVRTRNSSTLRSGAAETPLRQNTAGCPREPQRRSMEEPRSSETDTIPATSLVAWAG